MSSTRRPDMSQAWDRDDAWYGTPDPEVSEPVVGQGQPLEPAGTDGRCGTTTTPPTPMPPPVTCAAAPAPAPGGQCGTPSLGDGQVTFADLKKADFGGLDQAADSWDRLACGLREGKDHMRTKVLAKVKEARWSGRDAQAAGGHLEGMKRNLGEAAGQAEKAARLLRDGAADLKRAQKKLRMALQEADQAGISVDSRGNLSPPEGGNTMSRTQKRQLLKDAQQIRKDILKAIKDANEADIKLTTTLSGMEDNPLTETKASISKPGQPGTTLASTASNPGTAGGGSGTGSGGGGGSVGGGTGSSGALTTGTNPGNGGLNPSSAIIGSPAATGTGVAATAAGAAGAGIAGMPMMPMGGGGGGGGQERTSTIWAPEDKEVWGQPNATPEIIGGTGDTASASVDSSQNGASGAGEVSANPITELLKGNETKAQQDLPDERQGDEDVTESAEVALGQAGLDDDLAMDVNDAGEIVLHPDERGAQS